jgi:hypothetical protein
MAARNMTVAQIETTKPGTRIHARLRWEAGSSDEHRPRPRGYYLHVGPEEVAGEFVTVVLGQGGFCLVEGATRFNQRRFETLAGSLAATPQFQNVIERVLERNGLALAEAIDVSVSATVAEPLVPA